MIECEKYEYGKKDEWDAFVEGCKTPLFFFKRDFIEYHSDRFVDSSIMFYKKGKLLAIFPASLNGSELVSHGGLTYGGLLLSNKARSEVVSDIFSSLYEYARLHAFRKIIYKSIPYIFYKHSAQEDLYFITNMLDGNIIRRDLSSVVHLKNRMKLSKGRKWLIAKAKKQGLEVRNSCDWTSFHILLSSVLKKHGAKPVHSVEELDRLSSFFPDNIKLQVIESDERLLAAALLFIFDGVVHTQYLAASEEGRECGALDYIIETCIQEYESSGFSYFSFGISTEEQGKRLNSGLVAQKEGFGGRGVAVDSYEINLR